MKIALLSMSLLLFGVGAFFINREPPITAEKSMITMDTWQKITNDMSTESLLIDVRTQEEYNAGHIEGSTLLPLADVEKGLFPDQEKSKPLYVYCRSGNRSAQAKSILERAGFTQVVDLGAMTDVVALGGKEIR